MSRRKLSVNEFGDERKRGQSGQLLSWYEEEIQRLRELLNAEIESNHRLAAEELRLTQQNKRLTDENIRREQAMLKVHQWAQSNLDAKLATEIRRNDV